MRSIRATIATVFFALVMSAVAGANTAWTGNNDVVFTRNDGQWPEQVQFRARSGDTFIWLTDNGVRYSLIRSTELDTRPTKGPRENPLAPPREKLESIHFGVTFLGGNTTPDVLGLSEKSYCFNYFIGNDPTRWKTSVPSFDSVVYRDIYPGIDMKYYGSSDGVEYTFVLSAGADPSAIRLQYEGIESLSVGNNGELVAKTAWGEMIEKPPVIYQEVNGSEIEVAGSFEIIGGNTFGFVVEDYDKESELIIDPVLTFSTYFGGSGTQYGQDITYDQAGNIVVVGHTYSTDFPVENAYQPEKAGAAGTFDLFISKLNPVTSELVYSTYFGGTDEDKCRCVVLDAADDIYVAAQTQSGNLPTVNAYQSTLQGGFNDVYLFKLNSEGNSIIYATYLGGAQNEQIMGLAVDAYGCAYICGVTESLNDFDIQNAFQTIPGGGEFDGFVTKFSAAGNALVYSTFLGGDTKDEPKDIAVNSAGEAYVVGDTYSENFPDHNTLYPCQINSEGPIDAFITKFSTAGNTVEFSTFFGGTEDEWIEGVALDESSNVYLVGCVESVDFPTLNPIQDELTPGGFLGGADMFVSILSGEGDALLYSTYLGGDNEDFAIDIGLGPDGAIYVNGNTYSTDFPVANYLDEALGGELDIVAARIAPDGSALVYSTYLGGSLDEECSALAVNSEGSVAITGYTNSTDFPLANPYQSVAPYHQNDVFISLISGGCCAGKRGNFDGDADNAVNIADIIAAVSWTFESGPAPICLEEADTDGDGLVTIEDLVRLVNYVTDGWPVPVDCE